MKCLVTGGAGFIGSHLVRHLLARGDEVTVVDNFLTGREENLQEILGEIELIRGDLNSSEVLNKAVQNVEIIFHQAALPSVPRSIQDPVLSVQNNVMSTVRLLHSAVSAGVRRVVYAASSSAYGNVDVNFKGEELLPKPLSPYAVSKLTGEYLLKAFSECYGLETVGIRYFNVFGERQDPTSPYSGVIAKFCRLMLAGQQPVIFGDGSVSRDFTYISNVVAGNMLAAGAPSDEVSGEIMNVACGKSISLNELVSSLNKLLEVSIQPIYESPRKGDIAHSCASIKKAQNIIGYRPVVSFEDGLKRTLKWYAEKAKKS
jgi:nucleoside-diphosphate-sugar epimerase